MPSEAVLDASALLALLHGEPGSQRVASAIPGAAVCAVNLCEVVGKLADTGVPEAVIQSAISGLGLEVYPFDEELAYRAGLLRPVTRALGLSLGDRACLALAQRLELPAITTDKQWSRVALEVEIVLARP
ncbi:MAG: hypothetical protein AMXMBFR64_57290 [Myxococcales bacterium]